jgi:hypothetical protein
MTQASNSTSIVGHAVDPLLRAYQAFQQNTPQENVDALADRSEQFLRGADPTELAALFGGKGVVSQAFGERDESLPFSVWEAAGMLADPNPTEIFKIAMLPVFASRSAIRNAKNLFKTMRGTLKAPKGPMSRMPTTAAMDLDAVTELPLAMNPHSSLYAIDDPQQIRYMHNREGGLAEQHFRTMTRHPKTGEDVHIRIKVNWRPSSTHKPVGEITVMRWDPQVGRWSTKQVDDAGEILETKVGREILSNMEAYLALEHNTQFSGFHNVRLTGANPGRPSRIPSVFDRDRVKIEEFMDVPPTRELPRNAQIDRIGSHVQRTSKPLEETEKFWGPVQFRRSFDPTQLNGIIDEMDRIGQGDMMKRYGGLGSNNFRWEERFPSDMAAASMMHQRLQESLVNVVNREALTEKWMNNTFADPTDALEATDNLIGHIYHSYLKGK